jgi:hypothetical protein
MLPFEPDSSPDFTNLSTPINNELPESTEPIINDTVEISADVKEADRQSWVRKHLLELSMGALAASAVISFASHSSTKTVEKVIDDAPWVAVGLSTTETLWIGGAATMVVSAAANSVDLGKLKSEIANIRNNFSAGNLVSTTKQAATVLWDIKSSMPKIRENVSDSNAFKAGLWVNTAGAVGTAGVLAAGITSALPIESWGALGIVGLDLASTVAIRTGMIKGIQEIQRNRNSGIIEENSETEGVNKGSALEVSANQNQETSKKPLVRKATAADIDRLAEIDLARFRSAYGDNKPDIAEVKGYKTTLILCLFAKSMGL